jgi:hypothetical protein
VPAALVLTGSALAQEGEQVDRVTGSAAEEIPDEPDRVPDGLKWLWNEEKGYFILPVPIANPTIGAGLALATLIIWDQGSGGNPDNLTGIFGGYTDTDSVFGGVFQRSTWDDDRWRFDGVLFMGSFNLEFYGIGGEGPLQGNPIDYNLRSVFFRPRLLRRIGDSPWLAGGEYRFTGTKSRFDFPLPEIPPIERDSDTSGLGPLAHRDTRDQLFNPHEGSFSELGASFYGPAIGGDFEYQRLDAAHTQYFPVHRDTVATKLRIESTRGDVPYYDLPFLRLPGFSNTKYIGQAIWEAQAEYRWNVHEAWWVNGGLGAGQVGRTASTITDGPLVGTVSTGFRYQVSKGDGLGVGVDVAWSSEGDFAWYIRMGQSF